MKFSVISRQLKLWAGCFTLFTLCSATGCDQKTPTSETKQTPTNTTMNETPTPVTPAAAQPQTATQAPGTKKVRIKTTLGDMVVLLYDETPQHRDNFLKLAKENFYDGLLFHRCIPGFMAQGGDPQSKGAAKGAMLGGGGPGYTVPAEMRPNLLHKKGALSAARQGDQVNPEKRSSGSQFYIVQGTPKAQAQMSQVMNYKKAAHPDLVYSPEQLQMYATQGGTPELDQDYTVFGEVIEGLDVLDKILSQPTERDRPITDITMDIDVIE